MSTEIPEDEISGQPTETVTTDVGFSADNVIQVDDTVDEAGSAPVVKVAEDGIMTKSIDEILHSSMIPYSEYVIMDRALPRVEDGLKPVQRRIMYTMLELGLTPDKPFRKSARIVGDCLGKYHPHGDTSVYDAMVRMAQTHNMRELLVTGHGNFGSNDGDSAAAMRYTEARLAPLAMELLRDIDKDTVRWSLNFDDTLKEPDILPGRFPNLLVNGATGIAVGLATNIPPHNLGEVIDGIVAYIENKNIKLYALMKIIKGPDFPTGGFIIPEELEKAYETGKGRILLRAKFNIEELKSEKKNIVITELPYQVNKAKLLQTIAALREEKKDILSGISDIRDESDRTGMRAVITIKKEADADKIINTLMKYTDMQCTFGINMVAIAGGKPKLMGLKEIIAYYVDYQQEVVLKRCKFDLEAAKERAHIVEGLLIAIRNIDDVIAIIKKANSPLDAKFKLRERFFLSEKQAQAILDMRLARLTNLEVNKLVEELKELQAKIERLTAIIRSDRLQLQLVKDELLEIKGRFKSPRKSSFISPQVFAESQQAQQEQRVSVSRPVEDVYVALTAEGYLKVILKKDFDRADKNWGDTSKLSQVHTIVIKTSTDKQILAFTNKGYAVKFDVGLIKECKYKEKGVAPRATFIDLSMDEVIVAMFDAAKVNTDRSLLFFTKEGMVKKTAWNEYALLKSYFQAIKMKDTDEVLTVQEDCPKGDMVFVTEKGMILLATKDDVPLQGRVAGGVKGVNLNSGDKVIAAEQATDEGEMLAITNSGFGKRVILAQVDKLPRYRKGLKLLSLGGEAGSKVIFGKYVRLPLLFVASGEEVAFSRITDDVQIVPRAGKAVSIVKGKKKVRLNKVFLYRISGKESKV
ncbi:MAG: DNA topoisomerase 4 subunit A [Firmicutes bacterium]|nr:DNA topoisomerase 4 subunit A [Bacillota bacterium]